MVAPALARLAVVAVSRRTRVSVEPAYVLLVFAREGEVDVLVGSPAITMREPSEAPTEKAERSADWRRIVSPAAGPTVE